ARPLVLAALGAVAELGRQACDECAVEADVGVGVAAGVGFRNGCLPVGVIPAHPGAQRLSRSVPGTGVRGPRTAPPRLRPSPGCSVRFAPVPPTRERGFRAAANGANDAAGHGGLVLPPAQLPALQLQLPVQLAPLAHAQEAEEIAVAPLAQLRLGHVLVRGAIGVPEPEDADELGFRVAEL